MKKHVLGLCIIVATSSIGASEFVTILNNSEYEIVTGYSYEETYTEWAKTGEVNCAKDIEEDSVYFGNNFTQTESCTEKEERTKTVEKVYDNGTKVLVSTTKEDQSVVLPDVITTETGTHLEKSCHNIIINGYGNTDGIYKLGDSNDMFDVYCDMRANEGWTLIAKVPVGNQAANVVSSDWFANAYNSADILNETIVYNAEMSSIGTTTINKIQHTGLAEIQIISEAQTQNVPFYKTITNANMTHWFKTTEPVATTVCTDKAMTQNCESSAFEYWSNRYWLRGVDLRKYGYAIIDEVVQDIHFSSVNGTSTSPTLCSVTGDLNNNAWNDSAADGHWGNGMKVFIK